MNNRTIPGRGPVSVFAITRVGTRRRMLERLRPEGGFIPLNLDLLDVVAELDPGMIDWRATTSRGQRATPGDSVLDGVLDQPGAQVGHRLLQLG